MPTSRCLTRTRRRLKYAAPILALRRRPRPPPIRAQPLLAVAIRYPVAPARLALTCSDTGAGSPVSGRALPPPLTAAPGHLRPTGQAGERRPIAARALPPLLGIYAQPGRPGNASQSPPGAQP